MDQESVLQRIEPEPSLPPIEIPGRILQELYAHALEDEIEECCGLITGSDTARFARVHRCRNEMTQKNREDSVAFPRDGRQGFYMNEADYLRVTKHAEAHGEVITAVYHSHVNSDAGVYFSELDQEFAMQPLFPFPEAAHIVLAVHERVVKTGLFERDPETLGFVGRLVEPV